MDACQGHILFLFELQIGNANPRFLFNCSPPVSHESRGDYLSRKGSLRGSSGLVLAEVGFLALCGSLQS